VRIKQEIRITYLLTSILPKPIHLKYLQGVSKISNLLNERIKDKID